MFALLYIMQCIEVMCCLAGALCCTWGLPLLVVQALLGAYHIKAFLLVKQQSPAAPMYTLLDTLINTFAGDRP